MHGWIETGALRTDETQGFIQKYRAVERRERLEIRHDREVCSALLNQRPGVQNSADAFDDAQQHPGAPFAIGNERR